MTDPLCSRRSPLSGSMDDTIAAFRIGGETKAILQQQAVSVGLNLTDYVRLVLQVRAHGHEEVRRLQEQRLRVVSGLLGTTNGHESGVPDGGSL